MPLWHLECEWGRVAEDEVCISSFQLWRLAGGGGQVAGGTRSMGTGKQQAQAAKANGKGRGNDSPGWLVVADAYARVVGSAGGAGGAGAVGGGTNGHWACRGPVGCTYDRNP